MWETRRALLGEPYTAHITSATPSNMNPGGRPKGAARAAREACGGDPAELIELLLEIARGGSANGTIVAQLASRQEAE